MARLPRFVIPGQPQHVILRGNNRSNIFLGPEDYLFFLDKLKAACEKHGCALHAYVLMTNHVHFLVTPSGTDGLSKAMQMLGRYYVQYFNFRRQRTGSLFEGRYRATLVDSEAYFLTCMRYIEMNPVRAGMVGQPAEYAWSSFRSNAMGEANGLVTPHAEYLRLGRSAAARQAAYRALFEGQIPDLELEAVREATNKGWPLGSDSFKQKLQKQLGVPVVPAERGGDRKSKRFLVSQA